MSKKSVNIGRTTISYIEHGHLSPVTPTILLIHGYSSFKENWIDFIRNLPHQLHVVALDLPGHGSTEYHNEDLSMVYYVETVKKVSDSLLYFILVSTVKIAVLFTFLSNRKL